MTDRKIVKSNGNFMVLKPSIDPDEDWNRFGRRYGERGIGNYVTNESLDGRSLDVTELPDGDREYVESFIRKPRV